MVRVSVFPGHLPDLHIHLKKIFKKKTWQPTKSRSGVGVRMRLNNLHSQNEPILRLFIIIVSI